MTKTKVVEQGKALVKSKTFWFNALTVVIAVAAIFGYNDFQPSEEVLKIVGVVGALGNILLRLKTSETITKVL